MTYKEVKNAKIKEYLGFCNKKGFVYSIPVDARKQAVVAINNGQAEVLIVFSRPEEERLV